VVFLGIGESRLQKFLQNPRRFFSRELEYIHRIAHVLPMDEAGNQSRFLRRQARVSQYCSNFHQSSIRLRFI
jgi:hypothetical protein